MSQSKDFMVEDFPLDTTKSNISKITLGARYPASGYAQNTVSEMTVYILEGAVVFHTQEKEQVLRAGEVTLVATHTPYFWAPQGSVTLLIFSCPSWNPEQQQLLP